VQNLRQQLKSLLNPSIDGKENKPRVAIIGIGSDLRGDDAAGLLALNHLQKKILLRKRKAGRRPPAAPFHMHCLEFFNGGTAPENLTGEIRRFCPTHLIMLDAVDLGKRPGAIALIDVAKDENRVFLTHKLPVKLMLDYMSRDMNFTPVFLGIQPKNLEFGAEVSRSVALSCERLANMLAELLAKW